jgi:hypothetical protein
MDPPTVGEVIDDDPTAMEAWGGRGVGGRVDGGKMVSTGLEFKGRSCD